MGRTVAITGVNGYPASTLLPRLEADPEIEKVIGIDRSPWKGGYEKVRFFKRDLRSDGIAEILKGADVVFHLARSTGEIRDEAAIREIVGGASENVFEACVESGVRKVIAASSLTVYGRHPGECAKLTEESPLSPDPGSDACALALERIARNFFEDRPEINLTILRAGLPIGPGLGDPRDRPWSRKLAALPMGSSAQSQFIHEEDLGEALHLAFRKDLPGAYNVAADDRVPTRWCLETAGAVVISLPALLLAPITKIACKLGRLPASGARSGIGRSSVFVSSEKFKRASGWEPRYGSEQAFMSYIEARERDPDRRDDLTHVLLSWGSRKSSLLRLYLKALDAFFRLISLPGIRSLHPWMAPEKNSMSYLPINESLGEPESTVLPPRVVLDFIERASVHVKMDTCGCRTAHRCANFANGIGCLFMGDSALDLPAGASRRISKEQALDHARTAIQLGLVPMTGKVRVDNFLMMTPDRNRLLTVCFCCHCCCMMRFFKHMPAERLDDLISPVEGLSIRVTEDCVGCGTCLEYCVFDAITLEDGVAVHSDQCRGCGRCEASCPHDAVRIAIENPRVVEDVKERIEGYLEEY